MRFTSVLSVLVAASIGLFTACSTSIHFKTAHKSRDTVFLRNEMNYVDADSVKYPIWNKVFVVSDTQSNYYNALLDSTRDNIYDGKKMNEYFYLNKSQELKHFDVSMLPHFWLPLVKYRQKYYLNSPADGDDSKIISDSLVIYYHWEPIPFVINNFQRISPNHFRIQSKEIENSEYSLDVLDIYIIDPVNNVAIWKYKSRHDGEYLYNLRVARQNAKMFPLVVNIANEKPNEFEFDPIDFEKLLKRFKE